MKSTLKILPMLAAILMGSASLAQNPPLNPALTGLSGGQIEALRQAVCFAEPIDALRAVFADLATAPAGSSQQDLLKSRLNRNNLSFFCLADPFNQQGAAAGYEYSLPSPEQIPLASMRIIELGNIVAPADIKEIRWNDPSEGQAQGRFTFDNGIGNKGTCLFQARQNGEAWTIVRLSIQKTGSDDLADGHPVFPNP